MTYPFTSYEARDENGDVTSAINVYRVTEDHNNENVYTSGGVQQIHTGDVLVQAPNPNYVDVFDGKVFDSLGYAEPDSAGTATVTDTVPEDGSDTLTDSVDSAPKPGR